MKILSEHGRLAFGSSLPQAQEWMAFDFNASLFGIPEPIALDHVAITLADLGELNCYLDQLADAGAMVECPRIWPDAFCPGRPFPADLHMHFATAVIPASGTVVIAAPARPMDQLDRFRHERGPNAIHHIAALVDDPATAAAKWSEYGFRPLTPQLVDTDMSQQFLINHSKQIVELIQRHDATTNNFSCKNLSRLRAAED